MLPLYDWDIFNEYYEQQYTSIPPSGADWYASINVVLGIGGMISEAHSQAEGRRLAKDNPFSMDLPGTASMYGRYFRNAASCFIELAFKNPSLMAVQALCGMVSWVLS